MQDRGEPTITLVGSTASTNALCLEAIEAGAPEGMVFVADAQTSGRGRRETGGGRRQWFSPPGNNLYLSVLVRPQIELDRIAAITVAVGVALVDILRESTDVDIWLKWPNDLYVEDRKLGGILTEGVTNSTGLAGVAIGVGLNVNVEIDDFPEILQEDATSLRHESGELMDRMSLALTVSEAILDACDEYARKGLTPFAERIERWDRLPGRPVLVKENGKARRGVARGIGPGGGLQVEFEDGLVREIISGEVQFHKL